MFVLPRGKPVKEGIESVHINWQEVLERLHDGRFTGYLQGVAEQSRGLLLFIRGRLALMRYQTQAQLLTGTEALKAMVDDARAERQRLAIYRLDPGLAMAVYNLFAGQSLYRGQCCELLDMPHLIGLLKRDGFSGGLCVHAQQRAAVIFMEAGRFSGFFHDGESALQTDADLSASVAWQPGAQIDVIRSAMVAESDLPDLFEDVDLASSAGP